MWTTRVRPRTYKLITLICCNTNANTILAREGEGAKTWPRPGQTDYNSCAWIHITRNPSHNVMSHKKIIQFLIWKPTWSSHHKHEPISEPNESHQEEFPLHHHHHPTWHHQSASSIIISFGENETFWALLFIYIQRWQLFNQSCQVGLWCSVSGIYEWLILATNTAGGGNGYIEDCVWRTTWRHTTNIWFDMVIKLLNNNWIVCYYPSNTIKGLSNSWQWWRHPPHDDSTHAAGAIT